MDEDSGLLFREMAPDDLPRVFEIIAAAEPEDSEEAVADIRADLTDRFVMTLGEDVFGLTGYRAMPDTDRSYWLAWTGVDPEAVAAEVGEALVTWVLRTLTERGGRKVFTMIADGDIAPGAGMQRGGAKAFYERIGFRVEVRHRNYYEPGDAATILGYALTPPGPPPVGIEEPGPIGILDADELPETDDAYYVDWDYADAGSASTREEIESWLARIEKWEGRVAFIAVPAHAETAIRQLTDAGFREEGRLKDLVEDGIDEVRLRFDF